MNDHQTKVEEIEKKIPNRDKYITNNEFNKLRKKSLLKDSN